MAKIIEIFLTALYGRWHNVHTTLMRRRANGRWEYRSATDEEGGIG